MKIFSRISVSPISEDYEKIPEEIEKKAEGFVSKYEKYCISHRMQLFEVPIDSIMYKEFKQFQQKNPEYFVNEFETYERRFTKREMDNAEFYMLEIANIVYVHEDCEEFAMCCKNRCFVVSQIEDVFIEPQSFKNKHLGFTTSYRFAISPALKKRCEEEAIQNISYRPIWTKRNRTEPIAYQIEPKELLPSIAELNGWEIYKKCEETNRVVYEPQFPNPICVTKEMAQSMSDFNGTVETFAESGARYYIISKKMYEILKSFKLRGLKCEPITIQSK